MSYVNRPLQNQTGGTQTIRAGAELINNNFEALGDSGKAALRDVATNAQAVAGTAGVLPDAAGVKAHVDSRVTQSNTDATAGRLLKVGDGGYLGQPIKYAAGTLDSLVLTSAFYEVSTTLAQSDGFPFGSGGNLQVYRGVNNNYTNQEYSTVVGGSPRKAIRHNSNGTWTLWYELYHTGNILGTVSESGGVPTGAIIQRGSNANGEFVRFADGTQICWHRLAEVDTGSVSPNATYMSPSYATPVAFSHLSEVACTSYNGFAAAGSTTTFVPLTDTSQAVGALWRFGFRNNSPLTVTRVVGLKMTAIGRWW